ncbi:MAG: hypothetical protein GY715_13740 [Planctomycetes bacterium]|nr:hypothetical protein [Planctomycetota bacterium]
MSGGRHQGRLGRETVLERANDLDHAGEGFTLGGEPRLHRGASGRGTDLQTIAHIGGDTYDRGERWRRITGDTGLEHEPQQAGEQTVASMSLALVGILFGGRTVGRRHVPPRVASSRSGLHERHAHSILHIAHGAVDSVDRRGLVASPLPPITPLLSASLFGLRYPNTTRMARSFRIRFGLRPARPVTGA